MARVLITEPLPDTAVSVLVAAGHDVRVEIGLSPEDLAGHLGGVEAIIVRSATQLTAAVLEAARQLRVVGRAGTGVDNIDLHAASAHGVLVLNAAGANSVSMAEHTMALMLAVARHVPQADASVRAGLWERSRFQGVELDGMTLGVLGLGATGSLVAKRAQAFGMRVVAWDPWMGPARAAQLGVELVEVDDLFTEADFVSVHLNRTPDTLGLVGERLLALAKPGLRLVNCARGGIVDEAALSAALVSGRVAGAALDVFDHEPPTGSPVLDLAEVVLTPHLGGSTAQAQDRLAVVVTTQVVTALAGGLPHGAVNLPVPTPGDRTVPLIPLAERLGRLLGGLCSIIPERVEAIYQGQPPLEDTAALTLAAVKGILGDATVEPPVSYVNAMAVAAERGMTVVDQRSTEPCDHTVLITLSGGDHRVAGTVMGSGQEPRVVSIDNHDLELPLARHMLVVRNDDRVGMMAVVTSAVATAGVNIADMRVGRSPTGGTALAVLATDQPVPDATIDEMRHHVGILDACTVEV
ncbi:MAG TPA: phosphoglycerate dehydrogenase [Acidimicrobiales bacterium]|jgi:D-3-phosphoglycerate dehydrogenase|nr:phosphoglycerate dehydrogenase [Acidimicrobiales bacterium]